MLSGYRRDATVRSVGVGWRELAAEIEAVRAREARPACSRRTTAPRAGSPSICRSGTCVVQRNQRIRWVNMPEPDPELLAGKLIYVDELRPTAIPFLDELFAKVTQIAQLQRKRGPLVVETYGIDLLEGAKGDVLDRSPPPEAR